MKEHMDVLIHQLVGRGILLDEALAELEKRMIKKVLEEQSGNQSRTAKVLGIHRNTLSRKIELYKILNSRPRR